MIVDQKVLDELTARAKASPRLRYALRQAQGPGGFEEFGGGWESADVECD